MYILHNFALLYVRPAFRPMSFCVHKATVLTFCQYEAGCDSGSVYGQSLCQTRNRTVILSTDGICQYPISLRKRACPGTDSPASERVPFSRRALNHCTSLLPRPTSMSEPTIALTIFLRNLSALTVKNR